MWDKLDKAERPGLDTISAFVNNTLWGDMCEYMERAYSSRPLVEYSGCGAMPGWNVKYKKAGRGLCTLYPMNGYYVALVVIGQKEKQETELLLPSLSGYTQQLYQYTQEGMNQRWLMIEIRDEAVLNDAKQLVAVRRKPQTKA